MAGAGKKTFTAGEVLTASDVNTYLMEQSVMVFGGTAARASAIPTPSTGMTSYIGVTGTASIPQIETYTGSAWQTPYGLTLVASTTFTSANLHQIDNVFTSAYRDYLLVMQMSSASTNSQVVRVQFSTGGTVNAGNSYYSLTNFARWSDGVTGLVRTNPETSGFIPSLTAAHGGTNMTIGSPQVAENTRYFGIGIGDTESINGSGIFLGTTSFDGLRLNFVGSASTTGRVRIYGLRNT